MIGEAGAIDAEKHCTASERDNLTKVLKTSTESSVSGYGRSSLELVADQTIPQLRTMQSHR
jgi:hypothetical protein